MTPFSTCGDEGTPTAVPRPVTQLRDCLTEAARHPAPIQRLSGPRGILWTGLRVAVENAGSPAVRSEVTNCFELVRDSPPQVHEFWDVLEENDTIRFGNRLAGVIAAGMVAIEANRTANGCGNEKDLRRWAQTAAKRLSVGSSILRGPVAGSRVSTQEDLVLQSYACVPGSICALDTSLLLLGPLRSTIPSRGRVSLSALFVQGNKGFEGTLAVDHVADTTAKPPELYPHPMMLVTPTDDYFETAMRHALCAIPDSNMCARWSLQQPHEQPSPVLSGASLGGAFAVSLRLLADDDPFAPFSDYAVTAEVASDGAFIAVDQTTMHAKLMAMFERQKHLSDDYESTKAEPTVVVARCQFEDTEAVSAHYHVRIRPVNCVRDAVAVITAKESWSAKRDAFRGHYEPYLSAIEERLPRLKEVSDVRRSGDFCVCAAMVSLRRARDWSTIARVTIADDPWIATTRSQRDVIERGYSAGWPCGKVVEQYMLGHTDQVDNVLMRFAAGGSLTVLNLRKRNAAHQREHFIVVSQKDAGFVIHSEHLVPSSGLSETPDEWMDINRIIAGECVEEVRLRARGTDEWFVPTFTIPDANDLNQYIYARVAERRRAFFGVSDGDESNRLTWKKILRRDMGTTGDAVPNAVPQEEPFGDLMRCPAQIVQLGTSELTIYRGGCAPRTFTGLIVLDPEFGAIDLMGAVYITIEKTIDELRVLDFESSTERFFWRNVFVFEPEQLQRMFESNESEATAFFGRSPTTGEWIDGENVRLSSMPYINPPLRVAGPALLGRVFGLAVRPEHAYQYARSRPLKIWCHSST